LLVIF